MSNSEGKLCVALTICDWMTLCWCRYPVEGREERAARGCVRREAWVVLRGGEGGRGWGLAGPSGCRRRRLEVLHVPRLTSVLLARSADFYAPRETLAETRRKGQSHPCLLPSFLTSPHLSSTLFNPSPASPPTPCSVSDHHHHHQCGTCAYWSCTKRVTLSW